MDQEYLQSGPLGWGHDAELLMNAGLDFDSGAGVGCSYYECNDCGTFYLKEVCAIEEAFAQLYGDDAISDRSYSSASRAAIYGNIQRAHQDGSLLELAMESTGNGQPCVLDYGCGAGWDLSLLRAMRVGNVVGFNAYDYMFPAIRRNLQPGIRLVSDRSQLGAEGSFDAIRCNAVLEHVEEPNAILDDVYRLLKPGGVAFFYAPTVTRKMMRSYAALVKQGVKVKRLHQGHLQLWNADTLPLSRYVERAGFRVIPELHGFRHRDVGTRKGFYETLAVQGLRMWRTLGAALAARRGRYGASSFFARRN